MRAPLAEVKIVLFSGLLSISEQECRQRCYQDFLLPLPARGQKIHSKNGHLIIYPKHFSLSYQHCRFSLMCQCHSFLLMT